MCTICITPVDQSNLLIDIVPVDAKGHTNLIRDNDLRALLVNVLPVGSTLVAIIDSCHSESMLDLDHFRCNRVYTPWVSKGGRKSDPKRNVVVRHNDIVVSMTDAWASSQSIARSPVTRHATHDLVPWMFRQRVASKSVKLVPLTPLQIRYSSPASPIPFTESPAALYCTGFCDRTLADTNKTAYVVCISACKDRQRAWENGRNWESLSMAMINILRECPTPTLRDLMSKLNHRTYDLSLQLHNEARKWRAANRPAGLTLSDEGREANPLEMDNFQDPQLASHSPLDMDAIFTLWYLLVLVAMLFFYPFLFFIYWVFLLCICFRNFCEVYMYGNSLSTDCFCSTISV